MKQTEIDSESEADFKTFMKIFDAQRSIVNFLTVNDYLNRSDSNS